MADTGTPPVIPDEFQIYNSYAVDPQWQRKLTISWTVVVAFFVLLSLPHLLRSIWNGTAFKGLFGITESWHRAPYQPLRAKPNEVPKRQNAPRKLEAILNKMASVFWWTIPGFEMNAGQVLLIIGYILAVVLCIVLGATLLTNSNRAGFIAIAQLPIVFLFATKNSILSFLLGPGHGYEKLNFVHRWSGRAIFFGSLLHGVLWIRNRLEFHERILGQEKETTGVAAFALLCIIVISSFRPVRRWFYEIFYIIHILTFVSFFITLCYHTPYTVPWIFPPIAFYGLDLLMRMLRTRIKDAILVPVNKQMTLIHIPDCTDGWIAGQHVRLRVFSSGRMFESHPLTILSAPPEVSCITSLPRGITLGARVMGDWTRALNNYAYETAQEMKRLVECDEEKKDEKSQSNNDKDIAAVKGSTVDANISAGAEVPTQVMIDGPYGGCGVDLGRFENVLLFAGGAGATFTIGVLDDIVGRCVKLGRKRGEITRRIEFAWCIRSFGSIDWFAPALMDVATVAASSADLDLHMSIYVTCLCNPEAVPPIPNCDVTIVRPSIYKVMVDLVTPPSLPVSASPPPSAGKVPTPSPEPEIQVEPRNKPVDDAKPRRSTSTSSLASPAGPSDFETFDPSPRNRLPWHGSGGGLAVCASGPEGLTREAANAAARLQLTAVGRDVGCVGVHTEVFGL